MKTKKLFGDKRKLLWTALSLPHLTLFLTTHTARADVVEASVSASPISGAILAAGIVVTVAGLGLLAFGIGFPNLFRTFRKTRHSGERLDSAGSRARAG
jgi:hypothetical protein